MSQLNIIIDGKPINQKERPKEDEKIISIAIKKMLPDIKKWSKEDDDEEDILKSLISNYSSFEDGYTFAKKLDENDSWESDTELVNILDDASNYVREVLIEEEKKWVIENEITPPYQIGDKVSFNYRKKDVIGEIVKIWHDTAKFTIYCESLGHVKSGCGTNGTIINYENVKGVKND